MILRNPVQGSYRVPQECDPILAYTNEPEHEMTAAILDGKELAQTIRSEITQATAGFMRRTGRQPLLQAILVGEDAASAIYVRNKQQACEATGMVSRLIQLPSETSESELLGIVENASEDPSVDGILIQLPLPRHIRSERVLDAVAPEKDVDCFHPENVGKLLQGRARFLPCTPSGVCQLLLRNHVETAGKRAVIVGRSDIVGKPLAALLMQRGMDATVTVCHSRTHDLPSVTAEADILIAAIGQPSFITADMVRSGAVVIDVGINRVGKRIVGDVDFEAVLPVASAITPVPGGVGPLTIAMLLQNTLLAAEARSTPEPSSQT